MNHSPKQSSKNTGRKHPSSGTSGPLLLTPTSSDSFTGNLKSSQQKPTTKHSVNLSQALDHPLYSRAVSHANHSAKPDEGKEWTMTAISGRKCLGLFGSLNPDGSLVKTLVVSLLGAKVWYSNKCALTWKVKVTKFNRSLYQLSPSMRPTEGIGSGLLPTSSASDWKGAANSPNYKNQPRIQDKLNRMMPTPSARDWKGSPKMKPRDNLDSLAERGGTKGETGKKTGLRLQPSFALWMMGYRPDWLDLEDGEMPPSKARGTHGSRKSPSKSSK